MITIAYLIAYLGTIACVAIVAKHVLKYLKNPQHLRWELYPVGHEKGRRASYGGSYMEDAGWWQHKHHGSFISGTKALLTEIILLHATLEHNKPLWYRSYPFHGGLYLLFAGFFLTILAALAQIAGLNSDVVITVIGYLVNTLALLGFLCVVVGAIGLIARRLTDEGLRKYSTREHFFNLGAFLVLGILGLVAWFTAWFANLSFFELGRNFIVGLLCFNGWTASAGSISFNLYIIMGFLLSAYVPATHMGHFYMKYFLYHDIRWGDEPAQSNPKIRQNIGEVLNYHVSWRAAHIQGDGTKTWAEVATTNPTAESKAVK